MTKQEGCACFDAHVDNVADRRDDSDEDGGDVAEVTGTGIMTQMTFTDISGDFEYVSVVDNGDNDNDDDLVVVGSGEDGGRGGGGGDGGGGWRRWWWWRLWRRRVAVTRLMF